MATPLFVKQIKIQWAVAPKPQLPFTEDLKLSVVPSLSTSFIQIQIKIRLIQLFRFFWGGLSWHRMTQTQTQWGHSRMSCCWPQLTPRHSHADSPMSKDTLRGTTSSRLIFCGCHSPPFCVVIHDKKCVVKCE